MLPLQIATKTEESKMECIDITMQYNFLSKESLPQKYINVSAV